MSIIQAMSRPAGSRSSSPGIEDAMLLKRMRNGEEGAFEAIFRRHHEPLLSYCRHMLGNQEEAEDALQQAFIRAHRALLKDSPPRELRPWLYAIARNRCLSTIAARRGRVGVESELSEETTALVGLSDQVREREDLRELVTDIARLPEDQRSALLLAELDDLSHQEIAGIVGCEVSKVKALVYQARSTLIADRDARNASCQDIREELAVARGGQLRRGPLRRHLSHCVGCRSFQDAVNTQRGSLALVLPVLPSASLAARILGHGAAAHTIAAAAQTGTALAPAAGASAAAGPVATGGAGALAGGAGGAIVAGGAGATGGATGGAMLGSGVLAKVAVAGALALAATAGAVTIPHHLDHSSLQAATGSRHHLRGGHVAVSTGARARGFVPVADTTDLTQAPVGAQAPTGETQGLSGEAPALNQASSLDLMQTLSAAGSPPSPVIPTTGSQTEQMTSSDPGSGNKGELPRVGQSGGAHRHALLVRKRRQLRIAHHRRQLRRVARLRRKRLAERRRLLAERRRRLREERQRKARELKEAKEQRERLREERQRKAQELKEAKERMELEARRKREAREAAQGNQSPSPPTATAPTTTSATTVTSTSTSTSGVTKTRLKRKSTTTVTTTSTSTGN